MKTVGDKGRLDYLDGLRGIASLVVILHHAMLALHPAYANYSTHYLDAAHTLPFAPVALLWQGNLCVCIFFVLSGYVLAPVMAKSQASLLALFVRRVVRLALPTLAALLFGYALMRLGFYYSHDAAEISGSQGWWGLLFAGPPHLWEVLRDVAAMPFVPNASQYDPVVWTMHVEYFGSFGIFLIYRLIRSEYRIWFLIFALYVTANTYYFDFIAGALLADIFTRKRPLPVGEAEILRAQPLGFPVRGSLHRSSPSPDFLSHAAKEIASPTGRGICAALLFLAFLLFGAVTWSDGAGQPFHWLDWLPQSIVGTAAEGSHQIAAVFLLGSIILSARLKRFFSWAPFVKLGHWSFGIYLLHLPLLCSLGALTLLATHLQLGFVPSAILSVAAVIAVTLALAGPFTRFIDAPTNRLSQIVGRWVDSRWNRFYTFFVGKAWHPVPHGPAS